MHVQVDIAAPKVIVPLATAQDIGFLLLDCGHMVLKGGTELAGHTPRPDRALMWDITLSDIRYGINVTCFSAATSIKRLTERLFC